MSGIRFPDTTPTATKLANITECSQRVGPTFPTCWGQTKMSVIWMVEPTYTNPDIVSQANKQSEWKQMFMVGTYMKQIKMKGHKKLLRRYTKKIGKSSLAFLNRVITFKKCPVFYQNWGGWDRISTEEKSGRPDQKRGDRQKIP